MIPNKIIIFPCNQVALNVSKVLQQANTYFHHNQHMHKRFKTKLNQSVEAVTELVCETARTLKTRLNEHKHVGITT